MSCEHLSDRELLDATARVAAAERRTTVELLTLLAEVDARRLYLGEGCSSPFTYCTQVLHLSEHAAYHRIEGARAARQFPIALDLLAEGSLTLTTLALLRPHLTAANHAGVLEAARHKTKHEVEHQVACLAPRPDVKPLVRKVAASVRAQAIDQSLVKTAPAELRSADTADPTHTPPRAELAPLAETRYLLKVTISAETHAKLRRAQDLLRHSIPNGDPAAIIDRALTVLVDQLERTKMAKLRRPESSRPARGRVHRRADSRYIPADVKRAVWARDEGRCAFEGPHGRCRETGHLEFHHVIPFADGGGTDLANLALRCRAHNAFEGEQRFGPWSAQPLLA